MATKRKSQSREVAQVVAFARLFLQDPQSSDRQRRAARSVIRKADALRAKRRIIRSLTGSRGRS